MKKYFYLFGSLFLLIFFESNAWGQDEPQRQWSAAVFSGFDYSASSAMHGSIDAYRSAIANGTTASQYPLGGNYAFGVGFEAQLSHRYLKSPISLYFSGSGSSFFAGYGNNFSSGGNFTLTVATATAGLEYTFGQLYQHWNCFGRFGINSSIISTFYRSSRGSTPPENFNVNGVGARFGFEIEFGERYNIIQTPLGIEARINYTNVNLIGKSYAAPIINPGGFFRGGGGGGNAGSLNDGKNPADANDNARIIDYFSLRLGARYYF